MSQLTFDVDLAMKSGFFVAGTSGAGKSYFSYQLADNLIQKDIIVFVFDPSQAWIKNSNIQNKLTLKEETKNVFFKLKESTIFDLSYLYVSSMQKVVEKICGGIFKEKINHPNFSSRIFLIFEEAQLYFLQGCFKGLKNGPKEALRIYTVGRNFGIRCGLITQFPANVDKLAVKMAEQRYFFKTGEPNDLAYIENFVGKENVGTLKTLNMGECLYNLNGETEKIKVPKFKKHLYSREQLVYT